VAMMRRQRAAMAEVNAETELTNVARIDNVLKANLQTAKRFKNAVSDMYGCSFSLSVFICSRNLVVMQDHVIYKNPEGVSSSFALEHAHFELDNEDPTAMTVHFINKKTNQREKITIISKTTEDRAALAKTLQTHADFVSSHLTGNAVRFV
jgi:hypothetical protein